MRFFAAMAAMTAVLTAGAQTGSTTTQNNGTANGPRRPVASVPRRPLNQQTAPTDPKATEGLAAAGTMPAAIGPSQPLYTLRYVDLKVGDGEPARTSTPGNIVFLTVHYTGWLTDGTKFDSSVDRNEPFSFPVGAKRVITAWDTGFEGMHVGGKRRLIVPYQLAYGQAGAPPTIPPQSDLIFDVELLGVSDGPPQVQRPAVPPTKPEEHPE